VQTVLFDNAGNEGIIRQSIQVYLVQFDKAGLTILVDNAGLESPG
jgi:hypothetical protein